MRDVSFKNTTKRTATAVAILKASAGTITRVKSGDTPKGDPIPVAKVAAIQATKKTTEWIPYCHNIPIEHVAVEFRFQEDAIEVEVYVVSIAKTGVEMEAITAAAAAVITLYDMLKMIDEDMEIGSIRLLEKTGGKSDLPLLGDWTARVLVMSDRASRGEYEDQSGPILVGGCESHGAVRVDRSILADDPEMLRHAISDAVKKRTTLIFVTGGTGIGPRDMTFETLTPLFEKSLPGVAMTFANYSQTRIPTAMLGRTIAGVIGDSIVISIPGSPGACRDAVACLLPSVLHAHTMLMGGGHP
jgi:molybdenum cofactor biosynthesis protein MoaC